MTIGERIRARRLSLGASQERAALDAGMSVKGYTFIERGLSNPRRDSLERIASALGVTAEDLLVDEQEEDRASS